MTIGEKIYKLRSNKGISQERMALDLNVSRQAVSKWETDQSLPDLDKIKTISEYFNVSIDSLVRDIEVQEELPKEEIKYDANKIKRIVRMMLKTSIAMTIFYLATYLIVVFNQSKLSIFEYSDWTFVFPTIDFLKKIIETSFIIVVSSIMLKKLKENNKSVLFELVMLLIYIIGIEIVLSFLYGHFTQYYLNISSSHLASIEIGYIKLTSVLSKLAIYLQIAGILLKIALVIMMIVRKFDFKKYTHPEEKKELNWFDVTASIFIGIFLGIPGLLFEIIWLQDAKTDNIYRFKKMRFWYVMGVIIGIAISLFLFLIELL